MAAETKPLNPYLTALVVLALLGFTLAAVFAGVANAQTTAPVEGLSSDAFWVAAAWMLATGGLSALAVVTVAAVRWQPRPAPPTDPGWSISYPDSDR